MYAEGRKHSLGEELGRNRLFRRHHRADDFDDLAVVFAAEYGLGIELRLLYLGKAIGLFKGVCRGLVGGSEFIEIFLYLFDFALGIVEKVDGIQLYDVPVVAL